MQPDHTRQGICDRLGVIDAGYVVVVRGWASAIFGVAAVLTIGIVLSGMATAMTGSGTGAVAATTFDWWILLATMGLTAAFLAIESTDPEGWGAADPEAMLIGLHWVGVMALWWLGVAASPIAGRLLSAAEYYPAVTAMAALAAILFGRRYARTESWSELSWIGDVRSERSSSRHVVSGLPPGDPGDPLHGGGGDVDDRGDPDPGLHHPGIRRLDDRVADRGRHGQPGVGGSLVVCEPARGPSAGIPGVRSGGHLGRLGRDRGRLLTLVAGRPASHREIESQEGPDPRPLGIGPFPSSTDGGDRRGRRLRRNTDCGGHGAGGREPPRCRRFPG